MLRGRRRRRRRIHGAPALHCSCRESLTEKRELQSGLLGACPASIRTLRLSGSVPSGWLAGPAALPAGEAHGASQSAHAHSPRHARNLRCICRSAFLRVPRPPLVLRGSILLSGRGGRRRGHLEVEAPLPPGSGDFGGLILRLERTQTPCSSTNYGFILCTRSRDDNMQ